MALDRSWDFCRALRQVFWANVLLLLILGWVCVTLLVPFLVVLRLFPQASGLKLIAVYLGVLFVEWIVGHRLTRISHRFDALCEMLWRKVNLPASPAKRFIGNIALLERGTGFPWPSAFALLYPLGAAIDIVATMPEVRSTALARPAMVAGYGLAHLGYLLFAAGVWPGSFRILGLKRRWQVLTSAVLSSVVGAVLCNLALLQSGL
jgi:hypothetical protein